MKKPALTALGAALALMFTPSTRAQSSFESFGQGSQWYINAISADSSTLAGQYYSSTWQTYVWTRQGGYTLLPRGGLNNGSAANALSADGRVVVGRATNYTANPSTYSSVAYRWTETTGFEYLGTFGGANSAARGVSADGSVIVGDAETVAGRNRAFRWAGGAMADLGTLGGLYSTAYGVSGGGDIVVGSAQLASNRYQAFRWTQGDGMQSLGTLSGSADADSYAAAISRDGRVIVGSSNVGGAGSETHAFRWTQAVGMSDLGTLGGNFSGANAVSSDGAVVVGSSRDAGGNGKAFRWSAATGMQSVEAWLAGDGVSVNGWTLEGASGINADGSIVVGYGVNAQGSTYSWLARVSPYGSGVMQPDNYVKSVVMTRQSIAQTNHQYLSRMVLWGAHHRPLVSYGKLDGQNCFWATGDLGQYGGGRDVDERSGEVGVCRDFAGGAVRAGLGLGAGRQSQGLGEFGGIQTTGNHVVAEVNFQPASGPLFSATGVYGKWNSEANRGYLGGSGTQFSRGSTGIQSTALRLRADWTDAWALRAASLSPYAALTATRTKTDAYTETGGAFPARFDAQSQFALEARLGLAATYNLTAVTRLRGTLEAVYQLKNDAQHVSGQILGLSSFEQSGVHGPRSWARVGLDVDHQIDKNKLLGFSLHAASRGDDPSLTAAVTLRIGF